MAAENKAVITSFVEELINQGQFERADDLVAVDFVELDPFLASNRGAKVLNR
jgi:predicted SnoaL-like aldol condensation-catalyzing enzyme